MVWHLEKEKVDQIGREISQGPESNFILKEKLRTSPLFSESTYVTVTEAQNIWSSSLTSPFLRLKPSSLARALETLMVGFVGRKLDSIQRCPPVLNCLASIRPLIILSIIKLYLYLMTSYDYLHKCPCSSEAFCFF